MFRVCKIDADRQIVTGEVYAPNVIDSHGEMMLPEDVEKLAHRFMQLSALGQTVDVKHEQTPIDAYPIESFIAHNHPDYTEGAWVMAVKVNDAAIWADIKKGNLNGFSWQALVYKEEVVAEVTIFPTSIGQTESHSDHVHFFVADLDDGGKVRSGKTSVTNGHYHEIKAGTATEVTDGHSHRIFLN